MGTYAQIAPTDGNGIPVPGWDNLNNQEAVRQQDQLSAYIQQTHAAANVLLNAVAGSSYHITAIYASYDTAPLAAPAALNLSEDPAGANATKWQIRMGADGVYETIFPLGGIKIGKGKAVQVTLPDGGAGVVGDLTVLYYLTIEP